MDSKNSYGVKRATNNLVSLFVINTLVLFLLSIIGFVYLKSSSIEDYFKENVLVNIYLKNSTRDGEIKQLTKFLNLNEDVKKIDFISKEDAAESFKNEIGEEFVGFLGYNPLLDLITIKLYGNKVDIYNIEDLTTSLNNFEFIEEIEYDKPLVESLVKNFDRIGIWIISVSILFFIISFIWSYSFQILSEIRHWFWDLGYGFDLKISNITGLCVIFGSFISTVLIYFIGRGII